MKRALEAVLVVAALVLAGYVARQVLARRALAGHAPAGHPEYAPGPDVENPSDAPAQYAGGVKGLPMVKLTRPPKPERREADVPAP